MVHQVVVCQLSVSFFLNASQTSKEGFVLPYPVMVGYNCPSILQFN